jgi:diadenosine tetraphosphate (Ap4A) HIT family hydrolase
MNATFLKFGYPETLLWESPHWAILLRPEQVTLGSLVLIAKGNAESFAALPADAYANLGAATRVLERGLKDFRPFDKINYLMLMMVDPHVHFHVFPRYAETQHLLGETFRDLGWPGPPDLKSASEPASPVRQHLLSALREAFERADHH